MRDRGLQRVEAIIEGQLRILPKCHDKRFLIGRQERRMWVLRAHRTVLNARTLPPFGDGLRIDPVARTQRLDRSRRSLYCRSDGVSGRGASVKYLSHSVSFAMAGILPPPHRGTKHLIGFTEPRVLPRHGNI